MKLRLSVLAIFLLGLSAGAQKESPGATGTAGQLFVDVSAADYVEVIDLASRKVVDKIVVGQRPHGLAVARGTVAGKTGEFLYVTVEDTGELVIVDVITHKIVARVAVGKEPNQLTLTQDGRFAYVPLRGEARVAVVDLAAAGGPAVIARPSIGEWPHNAYTGATTGHIYVTSFRGKKIHVFDPQKHTLLFEMEFPGEVRPVALTRNETRAYVALSDFHGFVVADVAQRKVVQRVELPALPPGTPEPYLKTYVHGLALSPDEHELWVTSCPGAAVYVYSVPDLKLVGKVAVGKFPHWFAWQPPAKGGKDWLLWVSQMDSNQVSVLDPRARKLIATIPTGPAPRRIAVAAPNPQ